MFSTFLDPGCIGHQRLTLVKQLMSFIKKNLLFNDNTHMPSINHPDHNKLFKIRLLPDLLIPKFKQIAQQQILCTDEQMVPFKGHSSLKQY